MNAFQFNFTSSAMLLVALLLCSCTTTDTPTSTPSAGVVQMGGSVQGDGLGSLSNEQVNFSKALAHYASGFLCFSKSENTEALENWEQVIRLDPSRVELRDKIVQEFFRRNEFKKAAEVLEFAIQQDPSVSSYWTLLAIAYRSNKELEKAVEAAEKAIDLDCSKFPPYEVLFEVALESHDSKGARKVLDRASKQKSDDFYFWVRLADLYTVLSTKEPALGVNRDEIIGYYDKAIAMQPNDPLILDHVADFYVASQNIPKAIQIYQKILTEQPNAENIRLKLSLAYVSQGERKQAVETLEQIVKNEPFRYQVFSLIGELYEDMKDWDRASINYRLSLSANPNQIVPYFKMILLQMRTKHPDEALKLLDVAREKFPNTPQISYFYGLAYSESKDFNRAVEFMGEAQRLALISNPEMLDAAFYFYYGAALERSGQFERALVQFNKALEMNPDYADAYNYMGFMYADKNIKLDEALQLIEKALAYEPENGAFLDSLGWVYYRQGNFNKASECLQKAAKIIENDPTIFDHLGDVYLQMNKQAEALQCYQKALELDPNQKEITKKLDQVQRALSSTAPMSAPVPTSRTSTSP